jgi:uncharacterized OB-fold protein
MLDIDDIQQQSQAALLEGRLLLQRCSCGQLRLPPRAACPVCLGLSWTWQAAQGGGKLVSWVVYHVAFHESFRERVPYNVSLIELDEGPRMISNVLADTARLVADARVRFVTSREGERAIARFELTL